VVSAVDWWLGRRGGHGISVRHLAVYVPAQALGGICGAVLANLMFDLRAVTWSTHHRSGVGLWLGG
jgi:arsenate reductase